MAGDTVIWVDGERASALPLPDRGLEFGDGLFETLLVRGAVPLFTQLHLARMQQGCRVLVFPPCDETLGEQLHRAVAYIGTRQWPFSALRITLTRGSGPRGYAPPREARPRIVISATRLGEASPGMAAPAKLCLANTRWPTQPALAGLKHLNRLEQVMAAREYRLAGADEAVMLDQQGRVVSVVAGNLFLSLDGRLLTAALDQCGIAGTRRDLVMRRWAPALGLEVVEGTLTLEQLEAADEAFFCNSLIGLRPVARFQQRSWTSHPVCEALYQQYQGDLS